MKRNNVKGSMILCTAALIWGLAFVAQSAAAGKIGSFTFNSIRSFIGALFLGLLILVKDFRKKTSVAPKQPMQRKQLLIGGLVCGTFLTLSVNFQQFGLVFYPEGVASEARAGFITALYVILVPAASVFFRKKVSPAIWFGVVIALAGIYLLCLSGGLGGIYLGDFLMLLCAVFFSCHILSIDKFGAGVDGIRLSMIQFLVCGVFSGVAALFTETVQWSNIVSAAPQILYLGIMSSGIAYTLQIVGQKYAEPAVASLSMSLESVFAALGGWLIMNNSLTPREFLGCALVFIAIITAQLPEFFRKKVAVPEY